MKILGIPLVAFLMVTSCRTKTEEVKNDAYYDSLSIAETGKSITERAEEKTAEMMKNATESVLMDTIGISTAPIKVTKATLFQEEYSSYRDIRLTFKNVSNKTIEGIKFRWKGSNAFGEPADMGNAMAEGYGSGFTDKSIKPGRSLTLEWSIMSRDGKKVDLAWPFEVVFADGTKWKSESKQ